MTLDPNISKQKYLGKKGTICFIILMNMFIPLSTDLYLPAMPKMGTYFGVASSVVNLTLVSFFFFFAVGTLLCGPLSDKYGRKLILLAGSGCYCLTSVVCVLAPSIYVMIAARIFQGIGAGAIIAVSIALVKDCFSGKQREAILAVVQSFSSLAPMIAPVIGAMLLKITDWRGAFILLTVAGLVCFVLSCLYQETLKDDERLRESTFATLGKLVKIGSNIGFLVPCFVFSLFNLAFMGYIAVSSYIYVDYFSLSEQVYSYFFAANALLSVVGPIAYVKFFSEFNKVTLIYTCFIGYVVCGIILLLVGHGAPLLFWIGFAPVTFLGTFIRPYSSSLMLDQQQGDTGSASSLINGVYTVFGSVGMACMSVWSDNIFGLGIIVLLTGIISVVSWFVFMCSRIPCAGLKFERP